MSSMNERRVGNKQIPKPKQRKPYMSGVLLNRYQFIFDWHQGKLLPAPASGITPQNSELYTDAADQGEQETCQKRKTVIECGR